MTLSHFCLLPKSEGGLRIFQTERDWQGSASCSPSGIGLVNVERSTYFGGLLGSSTQGCYWAHRAQSPGPVSSSTTSNGQMTQPGQVPVKFQEQLSFSMKISQMLNSLSVPLTGAAAKPLFPDSFLIVRALCKWNKKEKKWKPLFLPASFVFPSLKCFILSFYSAMVSLFPTNARLPYER